MLLACLLAPVVLAQHEMPKDPTPSVSTDPQAPKVATRSSDFESIDGVSVEEVGGKLVISVTVVLSGEASDYEEALQLKLWADFDENRKFAEAELIFSDTAFAEDAVDGKLTFSATAVIPEGQTFDEQTMIRAVLCYGDTPEPVGTFEFGDIYDQSPDVQLLPGKKALPRLKVGLSRKGRVFRVIESAPGKAPKKINLISPKGTAISLTKTTIKVTKGDITLGEPTRKGRKISIPVLSGSTTASVIKITPWFAIGPRAKAGTLTLKSNLDDQTVDVGTIVKPTRIKALGFKVVTPGPAVKMPKLRITEGAAGQEDTELEIISPKGTAISLTKTAVGVKKGDIVLGTPYLKDARTLVIPVLSPSTSASQVDVTLVLKIAKAIKALKISSKYQPKKIVLAYVVKGKAKAKDDDDDDDDD